MKNRNRFIILLSIVAMTTLYSCKKEETSLPKKEAILLDIGYIKNDTYFCSKLNWKLPFPQGAKVVDMKKFQKISEQGRRNLNNAAQDSLPIVKNKGHLIAINSGKHNTFGASYEDLAGTTVLPIEEHQKVVVDKMEQAYALKGITNTSHELSTMEIGSNTYYIVDFSLLSEDNKKVVLRQRFYNIYINNHLFSVGITCKDSVKFQKFTQIFEESAITIR